ncbi:MAG: hypothetical protein P8J32_07280, partial [bacterium]|nr:hypothetical protein [bacterium]
SQFKTKEDLTENMIRWEDGDMCLDETLELFTYLISTQLAWRLQGCYGRTARHLIDCGHLAEDGTRLYEELPF